MSFPSPSHDSYALITGASQGIGEAMARDFAKAGYNLIVVARRKDVLEALAAELEQAHGVEVVVAAHDLSVAEDVDELLALIDGYRVSICVNSAGIASFGPFMEQDWNYETNQFNLNATAVFRITKAGVNAFTEALHYELKKTGVHCTLLAPGPVRDAVVPEEEQSIVDKVVPDFLWTTYESCSAETIEAMMKNRRRITPGPLSKAMDFVSSFAPRGALAPVMGWFYAKMG